MKKMLREKPKGFSPLAVRRARLLLGDFR